MKNKGFTLIEIIVSCFIFGIIWAIVAGIFSFNADAMNKSMNSIKINEMNGKLYTNLEVELEAITQINTLKFKNLINDFEFEFECYNPYNYINAPILKILYKRGFDNEKFKYYLIKQTFIKYQAGDLQEKLLFTQKIYKNADDIKFSVFDENKKILIKKKNYI